MAITSISSLMLYKPKNSTKFRSRLFFGLKNISGDQNRGNKNLLKQNFAMNMKYLLILKQLFIKTFRRYQMGLGIFYLIATPLNLKGRGKK